mmetsp:Transcript_3657/g.6408  ORF Transcript_3657/g.6408 Transcript_3657/m.6408 type:complete len:197 (+) Transcript_3657:179-769(+)
MGCPMGDHAVVRREDDDGWGQFVDIEAEAEWQDSAMVAQASSKFSWNKRLGLHEGDSPMWGHHADDNLASCENEEDEEEEENEDENEDDDGGNEGDDNEDNENSSVVVVISLLGVVVVLAGGAFLYTPRGKSSNAASSNVVDPGPPVVAKTLARFGPGKEMFGPDVKAPKKKRTDLTFNRREDAFENKVRARGISV